MVFLREKVCSYGVQRADMNITVSMLQQSYINILLALDKANPIFCSISFLRMTILIKGKRQLKRKQKQKI